MKVIPTIYTVNCVIFTSDLETKVHVMVYMTFTSDLETEGHVMVYVTFVNSACIRPNAMNFLFPKLFNSRKSFQLLLLSKIASIIL